jgi:hypothetical protein
MITVSLWFGMTALSFMTGWAACHAREAHKRHTFDSYARALAHQAELLDMRSERLSTGDVLDDRGFREPVDPWPSRQAPTDMIPRIGMVISTDVVTVAPSPLLVPEPPEPLRERLSTIYARHGGIGFTIFMANVREALRPSSAQAPARLHQVGAERVSARIIIDRLRAEQEVSI